MDRSRKNTCKTKRISKRNVRSPVPCQEGFFDFHHVFLTGFFFGGGIVDDRNFNEYYLWMSGTLSFDSNISQILALVYFILEFVLSPLGRGTCFYTMLTFFIPIELILNFRFGLRIFFKRKYQMLFNWNKLYS